MITVRAIGYTSDLQKVSLIFLVKRTGFSLKASKDWLDDLLAGNKVSVTFESEKAARDFAEAATKLGAKVEIFK